jgi:phosphatidylinositol kinase/protein kinase (PI-3  family)
MEPKISSNSENTAIQLYSYSFALHAVLQTLQRHQQVIVGLLQAIVNDPFVEWEQGGAKNKAGSRMSKSKTGCNVKGNLKAQQAMAVIQGSLQGVLAGAKRQPCRPMTVDAQVERLLTEAQDVDKLSRMFFGWLPFL